MNLSEIQIYWLGVLLVPTILGLINRRTKFLTRRDFSRDSGLVLFLFLFVTFLWPVALGLATIALFCWICHRLFVPKD